MVQLGTVYPVHQHRIQLQQDDLRVRAEKQNWAPSHQIAEVPLFWQLRKHCLSAPQGQPPTLERLSPGEGEVWAKDVPEHMVELHGLLTDIQGFQHLARVT